MNGTWKPSLSGNIRFVAGVKMFFFSSTRNRLFSKLVPPRWKLITPLISNYNPVDTVWLPAELRSFWNYNGCTSSTLYIGIYQKLRENSKYFLALRQLHKISTNFLQLKPSNVSFAPKKSEYIFFFCNCTSGNLTLYRGDDIRVSLCEDFGERKYL